MRGSEIEGLKISLAAAIAKLAQVDSLSARHAIAVDLGMPAYRDLALHTVFLPEKQLQLAIDRESLQSR